MSAPRAPVVGRVIRAGVVQDGRLVLEKRLGPGESLTVGRGPRAVVRVGEPRLPRLHPLVEHRDGRFYLLPIPGLRGKVSLGGQVRDLLALAAASRRVPLGDKDRGTVSLGDRTLLFQLVDAPPIPPCERTLPTFRPRMLGEDDPLFLSFLALFAVIGGVFSAYATSVTLPTASWEAAAVRRLVRFTARPAPPPEVTPEPGPLPAERPAQREPEPVPEVAVAPASPERPLSAEEVMAREAQRRAEVERSVLEGSLLIKILATGGEAPGRRILPDGAWDGSGPTIDWEEIRRRDAVVTTRFGWQEGTGAGLTHEDATIELEATAGGHSEITGASAARVTGVLRPDRIETGRAGPEAERVRSAILGYQGRIKACYERRLKDQPRLGGRVVLTWVVDGGRARGVEVLENTTDDAILEVCIAQSVNYWEFPADIRDFSVTYPFVLAPG